MKKILFVLVFNVYWCVAQSVTTSIDKKSIKIGEQVTLTLQVNAKKTDQVVFPEIDSIGKFEVVATFPVKTVQQNNKLQLIKKYALTQFDAGAYTIPSVEIIFNKHKISSQKQKIEIKDVKVDTLKQPLYDIKQDESINFNTTLNEAEPLVFWQVILVFLLLGIVPAIVYWLMKRINAKYDLKREKYTPPFTLFSAQFSSLESLKAQPKLFYSKATELIKSYFEVTIEIPALESTTDEFLIWVYQKTKEQKLEISQTTLQSLEQVFRHADLVKFAKSELNETILLQDQKIIFTCIQEFHDKLPQSNEEIRVARALEAEQKRQLKNKNYRQLAVVLSVVLTVISGVLFLGYQNIYEAYLKQINGKDAHYYLSKKWTTSVYGHPALQLITPKALERQETEINLPIVQNESSFKWNSLKGKVSISLESKAFKDSIKFQLLDIIAKEQDFLLKKGAKNLKVDAKKFKNSNLIEGDELVVNFELEIENETEKITGTILILHNEISQQILRVFCRTSDKEKTNFIEKIKNSIQLIPDEDEE